MLEQDVNLAIERNAVGAQVAQAQLLNFGLRLVLQGFGALDFFDVAGVRGQASVEAQSSLLALVGTSYVGIEYKLDNITTEKTLAVVCSGPTTVVVGYDSGVGEGLSAMGGK